MFFLCTVFRKINKWHNQPCSFGTTKRISHAISHTHRQLLGLKDSTHGLKNFTRPQPLATILTTMFAPGVRVARGPDWIWQNQGKSSTTLAGTIGSVVVGYTNILTRFCYTCMIKRKFLCFFQQAVILSCKYQYVC